ncbi:putative ubiquitin-like-specific protease 2A [Abeliophyllum distichum]|uniref:Ubiquitin-like-specific protease 2A n=1 Tax=Abeliophyllum distichum TaxID=126358 RepID=A0ABD1V5Z9_9LAMI
MLLLFLVARETKIQSKESGEVLCSDVEDAEIDHNCNAAEIDHNCNAASSLSPLDNKDRADKNISGFDDDFLVNSRSQEQTADVRLDKLKPGRKVLLEACLSLLECLQDETISMVSKLDESTIKRSHSSAIADDDASSDAPWSANCFSGCNMVRDLCDSVLLDRRLNDLL